MTYFSYVNYSHIFISYLHIFSMNLTFTYSNSSLAIYFVPSMSNLLVICFVYVMKIREEGIHSGWCLEHLTRRWIVQLRRARVHSRRCLRQLRHPMRRWIVASSTSCGEEVNPQRTMLLVGIRRGGGKGWCRRERGGRRDRDKVRVPGIRDYAEAHWGVSSQYRL